MVYNIDDKDDVAQHAAFHNRCKEIKYFRVTVSQLDSWKRLVLQKFKLKFD